MPKANASLTLTPDEITAAIEAAKAQTPALAALKSLAITKADVELTAVVAVPILGDCDLDMVVSVAESG